MLYGISAVVEQTSLSNNVILAALDVTDLLPPARAPAKPSSTRCPRGRFSSNRRSDQRHFAERAGLWLETKPRLRSRRGRKPARRFRWASYSFGKVLRQ